MNLHARFRLLEQNPRIVANQPKLLKEGKPLDPIHRDRKLSGSVFNELLEHCVPNHDVVLSKFILDELKDKPTSKFKSGMQQMLSPC